MYVCIYNIYALHIHFQLYLSIYPVLSIILSYLSPEGGETHSALGLQGALRPGTRFKGDSKDNPRFARIYGIIWDISNNLGISGVLC